MSFFGEWKSKCDLRCGKRVLLAEVDVTYYGNILIDKTTESKMHRASHLRNSSVLKEEIEGLLKVLINLSKEKDIFKAEKNGYS